MIENRPGSDRYLCPNHRPSVTVTKNLALGPVKRYLTRHQSTAFGFKVQRTLQIINLARKRHLASFFFVQSFFSASVLWSVLWSTCVVVMLVMHVLSQCSDFDVNALDFWTRLFPFRRMLLSGFPSPLISPGHYGLIKTPLWLQIDDPSPVMM